MYAAVRRKQSVFLSIQPNTAERRGVRNTVLRIPPDVPKGERVCSCRPVRPLILVNRLTCLRYRSTGGSPGPVRDEPDSRRTVEYRASVGCNIASGVGYTFHAKVDDTQYLGRGVLARLTCRQAGNRSMPGTVRGRGTLRLYRMREEFPGASGSRIFP